MWHRFIYMGKICYELNSPLEINQRIFGEDWNYGGS